MIQKITISNLFLSRYFDKKLSNSDFLGFAIQYSQSDTNIGTNGTSIDSENMNFSIKQRYLVGFLINSSLLFLWEILSLYYMHHNGRWIFLF